MPVYLYRLQDTGERIEARHSMKDEPQTWGELCQLAGLDPAGHEPGVRIERLIQPVRAQVGQLTSEIANTGFRRLEKRSDGRYEDVTAPKGEGRIIDPYA